MPPGSRAGWGLFALTMGGTPFAFPGFTPASTPPSPTIPTGYYDIVRQGNTRRRHTPNGPHKKIADTLLFTVRCNVISSAYSGPCSRHRPRNPAFVNGSDPHDFSLKEDPQKFLPVRPGTRLTSVRALKYRSTLLLDALEKRASVTPPTISWVPKHSNHVPFALITPIW